MAGRGERHMTELTDHLIAHLKAGRPLTALSLYQSYGIRDINRALWGVRIQGYHVKGKTVMTVSKFTGRPKATIEYRLVDNQGEQHAMSKL